MGAIGSKEEDAPVPWVSVPMANNGIAQVRQYVYNEDLCPLGHRAFSPSNTWLEVP